VRLFKSTFTSAADKEATVLVLQKVDFCQGKVECQRTHMMLHFISFEAQANMILEDFIFDGIVDGVPQPDAIIIPFSVTTVEREEGTGLDNLLTCIQSTNKFLMLQMLWSFSLGSNMQI